MIGLKQLQYFNKILPMSIPRITYIKGVLNFGSNYVSKTDGKYIIWLRVLGLFLMPVRMVFWSCGVS